MQTGPEMLEVVGKSAGGTHERSFEGRMKEENIR